MDIYVYSLSANILFSLPCEMLDLFLQCPKPPKSSISLNMCYKIMFLSLIYRPNELQSMEASPRKLHVYEAFWTVLMCSEVDEPLH